ncbi:MAG: tetratricopeptide repeat protein [Pseudomonadota bacterium]
MITAALSAALIAVSQGASAELALQEKDRLNHCLDLVQTDPNAAYENALAWLAEGARPYARQCAALSLIELGQEEEGAARLEALANAPDAGSIEDRAVYLAQSGNAWLAAGLPDAAVVTLTNAIKLAPGDPGIRKDRAAARLLLDQYAEAIEDLNEALLAAPKDVDGLKLRAEARLALQDFDAALADVETAMEAAPDDIDVLLLRGRVREGRRLATEGETVR